MLIGKEIALTGFRGTGDKSWHGRHPPPLSRARLVIQVFLHPNHHFTRLSGLVGARILKHAIAVVLRRMCPLDVLALPGQHALSVCGKAMDLDQVSASMS